MFKMVSGRYARRLLGAVLAGWSLSVAAQGMDPENGPNVRYKREPEEQKVEIEVPPPPYPNRATLVPFRSDATTSQVFIDPASISLGGDSVLRYTLVIRGSGGAENVTFEGMRCGTGERRVYAYGRRDSTWSPARSPNWVRVGYSSINHYYFDLRREVFCDGDAPEAVRMVLQNLKRGGRPRDYSVPSP